MTRNAFLTLLGDALHPSKEIFKNDRKPSAFRFKICSVKFYGKKLQKFVEKNARNFFEFFEKNSKI